MNFTPVADYRKYFSVFEPFIGATLQSLTFAQYHYNGSAAGKDIGPLELGFHPSRFLLLSLASDGETVIASPDRLIVQTGFTLDSGGRCEWRRKELDNELISQRLLAVDAQIDRFDQSAPFASGWILRFEIGFLGYHNFGDDAYVLYHLPAPPYDSGTTTLERIAGPAAG